MRYSNSPSPQHFGLELQLLGILPRMQLGEPVAFPHTNAITTFPRSVSLFQMVRSSLVSFAINVTRFWLTNLDSTGPAIARARKYVESLGSWRPSCYESSYAAIDSVKLPLMLIAVGNQRGNPTCVLSAFHNPANPNSPASPRPAPSNERRLRQHSGELRPG